MAGLFDALSGVASSLLGGFATDAAGKEQRKYLNASMDTLKDQYGKANAYQQPIYDQSLNTFKGLGDKYAGGGFDMGKSQAYNPGQFNFDFKADPGYQWSLDQGLGAINGKAAQGGMLHSPQTSKALMDYGIGRANQEYGDVYNRQRGAFENDRNFGQNAQNTAWNQNFQNLGQQFNQGQSLSQPLFGAAQSLGGNAINLGNDLAGIQQQKGGISAQLAAAPYMTAQGVLPQLGGLGKNLLGMLQPGMAPMMDGSSMGTGIA